jgi:hypothetical protein
VLSTSVVVVGALAGCGGDSDSNADGSDDDGSASENTEPDDSADGSASGTPSSDSTTASDDTEETTMSDDLDLREANVTDVEIESRGDDTYRFDVTLFHDDDGESEYANWWQVEDLAGNQLGRRTLLHAHSTDPFTRSGSIEIPADVDCVVVRGHDQIHGYGGQAMLVNVPSGAKTAVRQGEEPQSFDQSDCP